MQMASILIENSTSKGKIIVEHQHDNLRGMMPSQVIPQSIMKASTTDLFFLLAAAAAAAVVSCTLIFSRSKSVQARRLPPSPWRLPLVGNLHQLGALPHRSLRALAAAHGPVMLLHLGQVPTVVVSSADAAREVLETQDRVFGSRPSLAVPRKLLYGCTDIAFAPDGPYWRHARKVSVQHLLSPARVQAYHAVREEEVEALVRRVEHACDSGRGVVRLSDLLRGFAKDAAGRMVIGTRASGAEAWRAKVDALLEESNALLAAFHFGDFFPWLAWVSAVDGTDARIRRVFETSDRILDEIIGDASKDENGDGFVHALLSLHMDSSAGTQECLLTKDNVKAILQDTFAAGTDGPFVVMEWTMAELLRNKGAMRRLQLELRQSVSANTGMASEQDLPAMEYLRAVVKETLRLHSPSPLMLPRESMRSTRIGQYDIPSNARIIVNEWAISMDPEAWESPEEFRPERFLGGDGSGLDFRGGHFRYIPFGAGRRRCPGVHLAMSMVEVAVANLVCRFDWALPEGEMAELDMEEAPGFVPRKKAPLRAVATPRSSGH